MKTNQLLFVIMMSVFSISCKTEMISLKPLDEILTTTYYSADIVPDDFQDIYGIWKVTGTSGGFTGMGYKKDFDFLLLKKNGIFGILRNDTLIGYGKLSLLPETSMNLQKDLFCRFDFEKDADVSLNYDSEKYLQLIGKDTLNLIAPCCDRYNTHFVRENISDGYVVGKINIGPICPVETVPPRPECLPTAETFKAWQTAIWNENKTNKIINIVPDVNGNFEITLPAGKYTIDFETARTNSIGSNNLPIKFSVENNKTTNVDIIIDTGIR